METKYLKSKYCSFENGNPLEIIADVKDYIGKYECPMLTIDLKKLNIMEAAKIAVMSSIIHNKKYPDGQLKCKAQSAIIKNLISQTSTRNLEFVL